VDLRFSLCVALDVLLGDRPQWSRSLHLSEFIKLIVFDLRSGLRSSVSPIRSGLSLSTVYLIRSLSHSTAGALEVRLRDGVGMDKRGRPDAPPFRCSTEDTSAKTSSKNVPYLPKVRLNRTCSDHAANVFGGLEVDRGRGTPRHGQKGNGRQCRPAHQQEGLGLEALLKYHFTRVHPGQGCVSPWAGSN